MRDNDLQWWQQVKPKSIKRNWLEYTLQNAMKLEYMPEIDLPLPFVNPSGH
jgi:hypothetical protein